MDKKKIAKTARAASDAAAFTIGGVLRTISRVLLTVLLIVITTGMLFTCVFAYYVKTSLSTELELTPTDFSLSLTSTIWYKDAAGNYKEMQNLYSKENRIWVEYENMPKYLEYATVAIEDKRFYEHKGVDWYRTVAAFGNMFLSMKDNFGGSTVTQQLIKNLTKDDEVTVQRKLMEIFRALDFEKTYTKEQIMEWYLNAIFLGEGCYGVGTAAQTYYGKDVWDLSLAECASIIGITNNPSKYDPFISQKNNKERQETILSEMYSQGYISYDEYVQAVNEVLVPQRTEDDPYVEEVWSYYVDMIIEDVRSDLMERKGISEQAANQLLYGGGYQIYSCLNMDIQNLVDSYYKYPETMPKSWSYSSQQLQSAIVILDPYGGDILAVAGGIGEKTINLGLNRATGAQRPPGSSIKPISVYGPALDRGLITQTTLVNDAPNIKLAGQPDWYPKNADWSNSGIVNIRTAVMNSLNTVSAQILDKLTPQVSYQYLTERLGVKSLVVSRDNKTDIAYAPLSLGQLTDGITVREMAQAYTSFVNGGIFTKARSYTHITDSNGVMVIDNVPDQSRAFSENTAWNMTDMLVNAVNYGTGREAVIGGMTVAGKTGTTTDSKDRYFVGYTPYYLAAVWTGYDTPEVMNFYGNPATQIWRNIMGTLHEGLPGKGFPAPIIGPPTNIFGDMEEETATPSPSASESPSPSPSPSETPPATSPTPTPTTPVTPVPPTADITPPPPPDETPAPPSDGPIVTDPPDTAPPPPPPPDVDPDPIE